MTVGGNGQIEFFTIERALAGQSTNKIHQAVAQQRLAAREPDFFDTRVHEDPHQTQVVSKRQFGILRTFVSGSAIDALVIAAVRDADAEVSDKAPVFVLKPHNASSPIQLQELGRADSIAGIEREGNTPKRVSVPFQYGRPRRFRSRPSSLHSQQGAATLARYASGRMWSEPMPYYSEEGGRVHLNSRSRVHRFRDERLPKGPRFASESLDADTGSSGSVDCPTTTRAPSARHLHIR